MITGNYDAYFSTENGLTPICLKTESWHSTSRATLQIGDEEPQVFYNEQEGMEAFRKVCTRYCAYEMWEWEHGLG